MSHQSKIIRQSFGYKLRGWVLGLANMEIDRTVGRVRRNFHEELVELLEWIGLQPIEIRVQFLRRTGWWKRTLHEIWLATRVKL